MPFIDVLLGRPLPTAKDSTERVGPARGVAILGLDALASAAYGPEALLTLLMPLGLAPLDHVIPLTLLIVAVLFVVFLSYRQTIDAYPNGGGSYTVAKENLGRRISLVAAAALSLDYVLNVSVAISAGVGALVSAVPSLLPATLPLCLAMLAILVLVNLRGVRSTGAVFAVPTYAFVASLFVVIGLGAAKAFASGGHPAAVVPPHPPPPATAALTAWLLVRGFANGCTAMTGVEAVSNAVPIFHEPTSRGARHTLAAIIGILITLLLGIALLCRSYHVLATPPGRAGYESLLSQLTGAVVGRGWFYDVAIASIIAVLVLSANTSFAGFPRLCRLLAQDGFLPETFAHRGRRLVFSHGILVLGGVSAVLLVVFRGVTDALIPLFAVGAFLAFTVSQAGMVQHWRRQGGHPGKLVMNAVGSVCTGITLCVVIASKFLEGAWVSVLLMLAMVGLLAAVHRRHERIANATRTDAPLEPGQPPLAVVPIRRWDAIAREGLYFAVSLSSRVVAVQVLTGDDDPAELTSRWHTLAEEGARKRGMAVPELVVLRSEFRQLYEPLIDYVTRLADEQEEHPVAVVVPELVFPRWYGVFARGHTATLLRSLLIFRGSPKVCVVTVPWYLPGVFRRRKR
jgi:amino acid transporter